MTRDYTVIHKYRFSLFLPNANLPTLIKCAFSLLIIPPYKSITSRIQGIHHLLAVVCKEYVCIS